MEILSSAYVPSIHLAYIFSMNANVYEASSFFSAHLFVPKDCGNDQRIQGHGNHQRRRYGMIWQDVGCRMLEDIIYINGHTIIKKVRKIERQYTKEWQQRQHLTMHEIWRGQPKSHSKKGHQYGLYIGYMIFNLRGVGEMDATKVEACFINIMAQR